MIKNFFLFFAIVTLGSCHKQMGVFQASRNENFRSTPLLKNAENVVLKNQLQEEINDVDFEYSEVIASNENDFASKSELGFQKIEIRPKTKIKEPDFDDNTEEKPIIKEIKKEVKSNFRRRNPMFNDSLKIGLVFLLIAVAMAFFPALLQLMLLFAIVSMVFLFIGLKKLFKWRAVEKKRKMRQEKNEMRKEKIKDIFN